jgi:hypothetical protein
MSLSAGTHLGPYESSHRQLQVEWERRTRGARWARAQGCMWGVHGFVTASKGSLYTASVRDGRVRKYRPRKGVNPDFCW